jgi:hypothetical protein
MDDGISGGAGVKSLLFGYTNGAPVAQAKPALGAGESGGRHKRDSPDIGASPGISFALSVGPPPDQIS